MTERVYSAVASTDVISSAQLSWTPRLDRPCPQPTYLFPPDSLPSDRALRPSNACKQGPVVGALIGHRLPTDQGDISELLASPAVQ